MRARNHSAALRTKRRCFEKDPREGVGSRTEVRNQLHRLQRGEHRDSPSRT